MKKSLGTFVNDVEKPLGLYEYQGIERKDVPGSAGSPLADDTVIK